MIEPGIVSRLPFFDGDGYSWGGEIIVTFGAQSIKLGARQIELATHLSAAPDLLVIAEMILAAASIEIPSGIVGLAEAAIAKTKRTDS